MQQLIELFSALLKFGIKVGLEIHLKAPKDMSAAIDNAK